MKGILARLATIIFGIILAILVVEIGLRLIPAAQWKGVISKNPTRYLLYQTNRDIGWVHRPNARANWQGTGEYDVDVQVNSHGLHDREHSYEKAPDTFRILILGDSFANAIEVAQEQIFPIRLESCLAKRVNRKIEVVNGGIAGYGPGEQLLFFTHEGWKYHPDLVLVAVYAENDIKDMERTVDDNMIQPFGGYQFYFEDGHLQKQWVSWSEPDQEISGLERFLRRYSRIYYIFNAPDSTVRRTVDEFINRWWPDSPASSPSPATTGLPDYADNARLVIFSRGFPDNPMVADSVRTLWRLFQAVLLELRAQVEVEGSQFGLVLIPSQAQVHHELYLKWISKYRNIYPSLDDSNWADWDITAPNQAIRNFAAGQNIPTLDLLPGFQAYAASHDDLLYYRIDFHFNQNGHQVAANLICDWLVENQLVPLTGPTAQLPAEKSGKFEQ